MTVTAIQSSVTEYVTCNLCGSGDSKLLYRKLGKTAGMLFDIVRCKNCSLIYVNPRLTKERSAALYCDDYYQGKGVDRNFIGSSQDKQRDASILVRCLRESILGQAKGLRLLDIGGGDGLVSQAAANLGFDVLMCDISPHAIERARKKGIQCHQGEPLDGFFDSHLCQFDVVVALEVIEHVYDPKAFIRRVFGLLKPGGVFIYTTGNFQETRFLGSRWGYLDIPESHIYFFTPATMRALLKSAGFTCFLDPYRYFTKANIGIKFLSKLGLLDIQKHTFPQTNVEKLFYLYGFKFVEWLLGRTRLPFAVK
jgi:2-polyprenyl-3-methyl-5-hydroxy-6-metoxy-1,4-benzoquinol methylase